MTNSVLMQRIEATFLLAASIYFYNFFDFSFLWFVILLFSMDVFMAGYLINNRVGAYMYNFGHSLLVPLTLFTLGAFLSNSILIALGLIWSAHIGLDRALGYGLKQDAGFNHTHLGRIGKK